MAFRFDPLDPEHIRLWSRLSPGQRIQALLDARELAVGLIRGRLRRQYPDLSTRKLNLKVLEEIARREGSGTDQIRAAMEWYNGHLITGHTS